MANKELRKRIKEADLCFWQVADAIGISAPTFTVWLRHELSPERRETVEKAVEALIEKKGAAVA